MRTHSRGSLFRIRSQEGRNHRPCFRLFRIGNRIFEVEDDDVRHAKRWPFPSCVRCHRAQTTTSVRFMLSSIGFGKFQEPFRPGSSESYAGSRALSWESGFRANSARRDIPAHSPCRPSVSMAVWQASKPNSPARYLPAFASISAVLSLVEQGRGLHYHQVGRLELRPAFCQRVLNALVHANRTVEHNSLARA